jgi:hypothetical protein
MIMSEVSIHSRRTSGVSGEDDSPVTLDSERPVSSRLRRAKVRLLETPYGSIDWDGMCTLARFVRTELPYATIADIDEEGIAIERVLEGAGKIRLLVDLRLIVPRNDPGFEVAIANFRRRLLGGRERIAILVRTAVGALQVKRHMREDGFHVEVFTNEEEALAYLDMRPSERAPCSHQDWPAPRSRSMGRGLFHSG